jgi:hypothetical protein
MPRRSFLNTVTIAKPPTKLLDGSLLNSNFGFTRWGR